MANENDWGDGVLNNNIGWGQGADNNTIGWGSVYGESEAGLTALESAGGAPVNTLAPVISGTAERGETLTSNTGTWTGVGIITYAYQWKRDGSNISGAISSTYVLVIADDNTNITCLVTATDDVGSRSQLSNSLGPVLGSPYLLSAPVASGTAQVGKTLSTTNGTWQGVATITFTYQWRRDAVNISGATSSTYVLVAADYTTDVDCVVTATNGLGSANQDTNDISNIAGTLPIISGVPSISAETQVGETITATAASVTGVPTPTTSWTWQRSSDGSTGWADIIGATSITYTLVAADDANYVRAVQTETNALGSDSANSLASAQITPSGDPDAIAFIAAAGITGVTEQAAITQLVSDLKGEGSTTNNTNVWDNFYALYPMCPIDGSTATLDGFKYNLKDPRDLDAAFRIDWVNAPTAAISGVTGNGSNQYGNTHFNTNTTAILNDFSMGYFGGFSGNTMGASGTGNNPYNSFNSGKYWGINSNFNSNASILDGFVLGQRTGATSSAIYNNSATPDASSTLASSSKPNLENYILARLFDGAPNGYSTSEFNLFFFGTSFTTNGIQDFYDAITTYNTALGR
jgi:hypothetical protein